MYSKSDIDTSSEIAKITKTSDPSFIFIAKRTMYCSSDVVRGPI